MAITEVFVKKLEGTKKFSRLLGKARKSKGLKAGLVVLRPQEHIGAHNTQGKEEVLIFLSGTARVSYASRKRRVVKDKTFVFIPAHTPHDVENIGTVALRYVYITAKVE